VKKFQLKKIGYFFDKKLHFFIPRPPYRTQKPQEKPSDLKREHPALQNMNILNFFLYLLLNFNFNANLKSTIHSNVDPKIQLCKIMRDRISDPQNDKINEYCTYVTKLLISTTVARQK
jgi:hypothetical protein